MTSHVFYRSSERPMIAARAAGLEITDEAGRRYIDGSGGAAVSCIGHGDPRVVEAISAPGRDGGICPYRRLHLRPPPRRWPRCSARRPPCRSTRSSWSAAAPRRSRPR